jgi:hypothetical protein
VHQRIHKSSPWNPPSQEKSSHLAPRPFAIQVQQDSHRTLTQEEIENEAFNQNKFQAFGLQLKKKYGTITPIEQEKLGVLQAKMDDFWAQRMEWAEKQPDLLEILIRNSQATQTTESQASIQSNTIQAKNDMADDLPDSSVRQHLNKTGMPDALKTGIESLSGYFLDDVRVHYNSPKPAQLQALAYTQSMEIHVAPGEEEHLPHEAWHVVQQAQGRVKPTMQRKDGVLVNNDAELEQEADVMGAKALATTATSSTAVVNQPEMIAQQGVQPQVQMKPLPNLSIATDLALSPDVRKALFTEETLEAFPGPHNLVSGGMESPYQYRDSLLKQDLANDPKINYKRIKEAKDFSTNDSWALVQHIKNVVVKNEETMFLLKGGLIGIANKVDNTCIHPRVFGGMPNVDMAGTVTAMNLGGIPIGEHKIGNMSEKNKIKVLMGWQGEITFTNDSGHFRFDTISDGVKQALTKQVKEGYHRKEVMEDIHVKFEQQKY